MIGHVIGELASAAAGSIKQLYRCFALAKSADLH